VALAWEAWPDFRSLVRQRLADQLTAGPAANSELPAEVGRFLGSLLAAGREQEGTSTTDLLGYMDRLALSDFLRAEIIRYTAAWLRRSSSAEAS